MPATCLRATSRTCSRTCCSRRRSTSRTLKLDDERVAARPRRAIGRRRSARRQRRSTPSSNNGTLVFVARNGRPRVRARPQQEPRLGRPRRECQRRCRCGPTTTRWPGSRRTGPGSRSSSAARCPRAIRRRTSTFSTSRPRTSRSSRSIRESDDGPVWSRDGSRIFYRAYERTASAAVAARIGRRRHAGASRALGIGRQPDAMVGLPRRRDAVARQRGHAARRQSRDARYRERQHGQAAARSHRAASRSLRCRRTASGCCTTSIREPTSTARRSQHPPVPGRAAAATAGRARTAPRSSRRTGRRSSSSTAKGSRLRRSSIRRFASAARASCSAASTGTASLAPTARSAEPGTWTRRTTDS